MLTPLRFSRRNRHGQAMWLYACACGQQKEVLENNVKCGVTASCGCAQKARASEANTRHGHRRSGATTREYRIWADMKTRCTNRKEPSFYHYGARGIKVCERWQSFENFLADMGPCPEGMSLDRMDNSHGYAPENCRWATTAEQSANKRNNVYFMLDGEKLTLTETCRRLGISRSKLSRAALTGKDLSATFHVSLSVVKPPRWASYEQASRFR